VNKSAIHGYRVYISRYNPIAFLLLNKGIFLTLLWYPFIDIIPPSPVWDYINFIASVRMMICSISSAFIITVADCTRRRVRAISRATKLVYILGNEHVLLYILLLPRQSLFFDRSKCRMYEKFSKIKVDCEKGQSRIKADQLTANKEHKNKQAKTRNKKCSEYINHHKPHC